MARPIVLSNGNLHVGLNKFGLVHDFYFPYVGLENHAAGHMLRHHVGVWVDGRTSWLDLDSDWTFAFSYPHHSLIGHTIAKNDRIGIILEFDDTVDSDIDAFLRNIHVINRRSDTRDIRLFMHQAFAIGDSRSNTDTAQYLPDSDAILHYRGRRVFVISGQADSKPFDQYTVGLFGIEGHEGTFRDAEDGELSFCNVEHGRVDSTIRFKLTIEGNSSSRVHYWVAAGRTIREALSIEKTIREAGVDSRLHETASYWHRWLAPSLRVAERLPEEFRDSFLKSALTVKSQIDNRGAVIASTDSTMLNYGRDAYAYCWPRDGAYVLWPLIRMGYRDEPLKFFEFCREGLHPSGYLMHKYRADGALGSSWHPYFHESENAPPIQEDETALVLFVFAQFYHAHADKELLDNYYMSFIVPMADFLAGFVDERTGLPRASYDLWEQVFMTTTYTTAVTYAALLAAAELADIVSDSDNAVRWRSSAEDIQAAAKKHLFNDDKGILYKGITIKDSEIQKDATIDCSATFGSFLFGLFDTHDKEIAQSVKTIEQEFGISESQFGLPRYENDEYRRSSPVTGNYWPIASLWLAQYYIETGRDSEAHDILAWVRSHSTNTGLLPEQIDPVTNELIAPVPLTWSHAEYLATLLDMTTET